MSEIPSTRASLLLRLRDGQDHEAWLQFVDLYGPLIYRFGRKRGLQDADAADLTQLVLQAVSGAIQRLDYDAGRGTFRGWLFTVVRYQLSKFLEQRRKQPQAGGPQAVLRLLEELPALEEDASWWEQEYQQQTFLWAAERVRGHFAESSWQAFWLTAVEGQSIDAVAQALGLTVGAIYTARSRIIDRLRKEIQLLEDDQATG
jgi:RNA polymerase sigma-70 factor (ECF subfamily)